MATLIPPSSSNVEAAYEDMFKEITRKLYGEETGNGLHTLGTPVAQVATTGPTAPEGERSFTNLQIDRSAAPTIEYEHNANNAAATAAAAAAAAAAAVGANVVIQQQPEGSVVVATTVGGAAGGGAGAIANFKTEDHLNTAFGLAALMQNGFTTATTAATASGSNDQQQQQQQQQPQIVQWTTTTGGKLQSYTTTQQQQQQQQQHVATTSKSKSHKNRNEHVVTVTNAVTDVIYTSPSTSGNAIQQQQQQLPTATVVNITTPTNTGGSRKKSNNSNNQQNSNQNNANNTSNSNNGSSNNNGGVQIQKRYACTHCPYSTDRRDLYTRHENIHKDEKPFQCYACLKQFNRADHVKKHFLRMHRELQYDINKTRRHVPSSSTSNHHSGGRGNVTINATAANIQIDNAFLESQRQPTSSSLSIAETIEAVATAADEPLPQLKQERNDDGSLVGGGSGNGGISVTIKPKREKRFTCCYCPWSGADKWGLKRHLNTHTKPFVCLLCDYKAARSERLATHVLKVHNKRACNKCSFLADTQEEYQTHISEVHPHDNRPSRSGNSSNNNNSNNTNNTNTTSNNINVLRTIGNTLVTNNQLNSFQNTNTTFGSIGNSTTTTTVGNAGGSVTIYTTTTTDNGNGIAGGGPLQEIIVNPTSMVGWRLSANGSLIPPHDLLTGSLPNAAAQKRGSERLFQYLEADGSDPEDYARLLKMDAISRNTASVAQDFHKAGGVHELKIPANHQLLFNNKLPSQWTTREAAALLHSLSNAATQNINFAYQQQQQQSERFKPKMENGAYFYNGLGVASTLRTRQHSTGEDDENTPSSASSTTSSDGDGIGVDANPRKRRHNVAATEQRRAMTAFLSKNFDLQESNNNNSNSNNNNHSSSLHKRYQQQFDNAVENVKEENEDQENQVQLIRSPPAYNNNFKNNSGLPTTTKLRTNKQQQHSRNHRPELFKEQRRQRNKENQHHQQQQTPQEQEQQMQQQAASLLTQMEYQNFNKIGTQFQNYVKDIINKYYAETPLLFPAMPTAATTVHNQQELPAKKRRLMSETEEYIEYLKNKEDITLTITPKQPTKPTTTAAPVSVIPNITNIDLSITAAGNSKTSRSLKQQSTENYLSNDAATPTYQMPNMGPTNAATIARETKTNRKSLSQLATLLPLLADAASQQQYLAAPLDFSKKATMKTEAASPNTDHPGVNEQHFETTQLPRALGNTTPTNDLVLNLSCSNSNSNSSFSSMATSIFDKRTSRKQAQPKKIRMPPEVVLTMLRDKYLNRLTGHKLSCAICSKQRHHMLVFNYHSKGSLALHHYWKHRAQPQNCANCDLSFKQSYSLKVHRRLERGACRRRQRKNQGAQELRTLADGSKMTVVDAAENETAKVELTSC